MITPTPEVTRVQEGIIMAKVYDWELKKARKEGNGRLKDWIWLAVSCGQPIPGCISVEACRAVLRERGDDDRGYHNT